MQGAQCLPARHHTFQLSFIEFEGVSDGESIKRLLSQIKPRQLILIHGSSDATHHLADYAKANGMRRVCAHVLCAGIAPDRVFTPRVGDVVDATIESHIYQVTLSDSLMCSLLFQPVKDAELSWIDAKITIHKPDAIADQSPVDAGALPAQPEEMQVCRQQHAHVHACTCCRCHWICYPAPASRRTRPSS